ncbi:MAG: DUF892 family protein [Nitrososphaeraceae archaeon]
MVDETENVMMKVENEFIECKQDAIIENAEIVSYKILIEIAKKVNGNDAIPILEQNLKQEESMATWIMTNVPKMLDKLWQYMESSPGNRPIDAFCIQ